MGQAVFQLFGEIARGGMGAILKGHDPDLGHDLAVKVLLDSHRDNPDLVLRFIEEAQIAGQLQHPGVVRVLRAGPVRRLPALLLDEVGQGPHAGRSVDRLDPAHELSTHVATWLRSARRWPTLMRTA